MSVEPLRSADKRLALLVLVLIAAATLYTLRNYNAAFPQASLDLKYSKGEITALAERVLAEQGLSPKGFRNLTLFDPDESARLFLEHEVGLTEANRLMQGEVSVWRWRARWFRPPDEEELIVRLSPTGKLVGFRHVIPEAQPGARLDRDAARRLAQEYLNHRTSLPHRLIEETTEERPARLDRVFTWEREGFHVKDATYRWTVVIQGDKIGSYSEYLKVPERWDREYAAMRSANELYTDIAQAFYLVLILAAMAVLIRALQRRDVRWGPLVTICSVATGVAVLNQWNMLPFFVDSMPTSMAYREMILLGVLQGLGTGVFYFFFIILGAAPGEPLYRGMMPDRLRLTAGLSPRGIRTREFFRATLAGYGLTSVHLIFLIAFYIVGQRLGVWSPQDTSYSDLLSTTAPWLYPLSIGVLASLSEEFWFRLLAVPLLKRYLRSTWLAVLIPAFIWGFMHANYPQQPGFIRGLEVGIIGVVAGLVLLRFGILATLIWHYTIDALLVSTILFQSQSWYLWAAGILVSGAVLVPFGISLISYRRHGGFLVAAALENRAVPEPETPPPAAEPERGEPMRPPWRRRWLYVAAGVALVAGLAVRYTQLGDFVQASASGAQARATADAMLRSRGVDPDGWRSASRFLVNLDTADFEYVRRLRGREAANRVVREKTIYGVWYVRYVRPQQREEWRVYVNQAGDAYRVDHVLAETAPGANLTAGEALLLAQAYLADVQGIALDNYRPVDSGAEKREHRTDYNFVWEEKDFRVGEATARISMTLTGDEPGYFRRFLKLPESWEREFRRPRLQEYVMPALLGAIGFTLLIVFVGLVSAGQKGAGRLAWRWYTSAGVAAALLAAVGAANGWGDVLISYNTAEPLASFISQWLLTRGILIALVGLGAFLTALAADLFVRDAVGRRRLNRPSVVRAAAMAVLLGGAVRLFRALGQAVPGDRFSLALWDLPGAGTALPALSVLTQALVSAAIAIAVVVVVGAAAWKHLRNRTGAAVAAVVVGLIALSQSVNIWQWSFHAVAVALGVGVVALLLLTCGLDLVSAGVAVFWVAAAGLGAVLVEQPAAVMRWNGAVALVVAALAGVGAILLARRCQAESSPPSDPQPSM